MNCIIVDDEPLARQEMAALIQEVSDLEILGSFSNAHGAIQFLKTDDVDVIFLDIEMPMVNGLEFAALLPKDTLVIFTTAYPQYALESYDLDAIDYLVKPIDRTRLGKAITKAKLYKSLLSEDTDKNVVDGITENFLMVKSERRFHKVNFFDIRYIEGLKDYVVIYSRNQKLITAMNLKTIHQKVPQKLFLRVSKSYLVNTEFIDSFDHHTIYLGETEIPLGEVFKKDFFKLFSGGLVNPEG